MTVAEFRELGYLQEVNRRFLHPLGLALSVAVDSETGEESFGGIWDCRDDPEGLIFDAFHLAEWERAIFVHGEWADRCATREKSLGWAIQPIDLLPKELLLCSTEDRDVRALLTKALYKLLNLWPLPCRKDYYCYWMYPYGFVPEAGCPVHD